MGDGNSADGQLVLSVTVCTVVRFYGGLAVRARRLLVKQRRKENTLEQSDVKRYTLADTATLNLAVERSEQVTLAVMKVYRFIVTLFEGIKRRYGTGQLVLYSDMYASLSGRGAFGIGRKGTVSITTPLYMSSYQLYVKLCGVSSQDMVDQLNVI